MLDKILWWISLSCLGLFANLLVGGMLSWSDRKAVEIDPDESKDPPDSQRWMWRGWRTMYVMFFIVSCVLMGLGVKSVAAMLGL